MMRLRTLRWSVTLGLAVLLLPSCTDSKDDGSDTTLTPTTTVAETTTTAPAATTTAPTTATTPTTTTTIPSTTVAPIRVSGSLALVNGTLIGGTGSDPVADGVVVIDGERIVAVGASGAVAVSPDTPTVDVEGAAVLPGFVNAHVHMAYDKERLEAWAQSGVTTVRDLGAALWQDDDPDKPPIDLCPSTGCANASELFMFREEVSGDSTYVRLVAAGPIVSGPRQHVDVWLNVTSPEDARPTIEALVDDGADVVKIYIVEQSPTDTLTQDTLAAIVEVAHAGGVPPTAHVQSFVQVRYALDAGADDLAHMVFTTLADDLVARVVANDVYWVPTLEVVECAGGDLSTVVDNLRSFSEAGGKVALGTDYHDVERHPEFSPSLARADSIWVCR